MGKTEQARIAAENEARNRIGSVYAPITGGASVEEEKARIQAEIARVKAAQAIPYQESARLRAYRDDLATVQNDPRIPLWQKNEIVRSLQDQINRTYNAEQAQRRNLGEAVSRLQERYEALQSGESLEAIKQKRLAERQVTYSKPSDAIGYNPATGQVEAGRGDTRGTVVSLSKYDEKTQMVQKAKAAGYTTGATVDPRSQFFQPIEGPNIFTGKVYTPPEPTKPQIARKQILTDQPDSRYANPDFVQPEQDKMTELQRTLTGFAESAIPPRRQYRYELGLNEGLQLGATPTPTSQDARVWLANRSAEGYKFVDINVGGTVKRVKISQAYAELSTLPSEATLSISYNDPKAIKERAAGIEARRDIFGWIQEAKESGINFISIRTETGDLTVPISQAGSTILSTRGIIGIGAVPNVPTGYTVTSGGNISRATLVPVNAPKPIERKPVPGDILGETLYNLEKLKSKNPLVQVGKTAFLDIGVGVGGVVNLGREYLVKPLMEGLTGKPLLEASTQSYIPEKATPTLTLEEGLVRAGQEAIQKKDFRYFPGGAASAYEEFINATQSQGPIVTATDIATQTLMTIGPGGISKIAPLRKLAIAIPVTKRVPTIIGAPSIIVEDALIASGIKLGYSKTVSPLMVGAIQGGDYFMGVPKPSKISALQRFEAPAARGGYPITEELSGYMTRPQTLDYLAKIGKLKPEEAEILKASKRYGEITSSYPDEVIRTILPEQPVRSIEKGPETSESFRLLSEEQRKRVSSLGPHYGSYTEQFYMLPDYLEQSRDLDFHLVGKKAGIEAERIAKEWGTGLQSVTRPERQFFVKTKHDDVIDLVTGKKTGEKEIDRVVLSVTTEPPKESRLLRKGEGREKVSELIVKPADAPKKLGEKYTSMQNVLGQKVPTKTKKVKNVKIGETTIPSQEITIFRRQELRRMSAAFEYQKGGKLLADPGREKEYTKLYGIAKTREAQALKMGRTKEAAEIAAYAEKVKSFAKKRGIWSEGLKVSVNEMPDESGIIIKPSKLERVESKIEGIPPSSISSGGSKLRPDQVVPPSPAPRDETLDIKESEVVNKDINSRIEGSRITPSRVSSRSALSSISRGSAISKIEGSQVSKSKIGSGSRMGLSKISSRTSSRVTGYKPEPISKATQSNVSTSRLTGYAPSGLTGSPVSRITTVPTSRIIPVKTIPATKMITIENITRPPPVVPFDKLTTKSEKRIKEIEGERANFLGNTYVEQITGLTKRADITYGLKRTAKLERQDIAFSRRGKTPFVSNRKSSLLSLKKPGILKPNKGKRIRL